MCHLQGKLFQYGYLNSQLAQLFNPTAKSSSKVPGLLRFFGACIFGSPVPAPEIETQQIRCWELEETVWNFEGTKILEERLQASS